MSNALLRKFSGTALTKRDFKVLLTFYKSRTCKYFIYQSFNKVLAQPFASYWRTLNVEKKKVQTCMPSSWITKELNLKGLYHQVETDDVFLEDLEDIGTKKNIQKNLIFRILKKDLMKALTFRENWQGASQKTVTNFLIVVVLSHISVHAHTSTY